MIQLFHANDSSVFRMMDYALLDLNYMFFKSV